MRPRHESFHKPRRIAPFEGERPQRTSRFDGIYREPEIDDAPKRQKWSLVVKLKYRNKDKHPYECSDVDDAVCTT